MTLIITLFTLFAGHTVQADDSPSCPQWLIDNLSPPTHQERYFTDEKAQSIPALDVAVTIKHMEQRGISFLSVTLDDSRALQITPGDESNLNKLASILHENYDADLAVHFSLLRSSTNFGNATLWKPESSSQFKPLLVLGARSLFSLIEMPMRDIAVLHEIRHVKMLDYLIRRVPYSLYGRIRKARLDPLASSENDYTQSLNFDEIKAFHTQLKEEVIIIKGGIVRGLPIAAERLYELLLNAVQLTKITDRSIFALQLLENAYRSSPASIKFVTSELGIVEATLTVNEDTVALPLIDVNSPVSPNAWSAFERQVAWLKATVTEAHHQASDVKALLKNLIESADERRMDLDPELSYLANIQNVLAPTKLRLHTPPSASEAVQLMEWK